MKAILPLLGSLLIANLALAQSSSFTYQGRLDTPQGPANGLYDFRCQLYDDEQFGALVSTTITNPAVRVTNGLFLLNLDFGPTVFNGQSRWLLITLRTNNGLNFTALLPRQRLSPTPYAIYASKAADLQSGVSPTFTGNVTFSPPSGPPFSVGSSAKVTSLNADWLDGLDSTAFVQKAGDTMSGSLTIANPAVLNFGNTVRQMLNLWSTEYGIGVQAAALYFRTAGGYAWFRQGVHANGTFDPGGGTALMTLNSSGNLSVVANNGGSAVSGDAGNFGGGVGLRGEAAGGFSVGVRGHTSGALSAGVYGVADGTNGAGLYGLASFASGVNYGAYGESHSLLGYGVFGHNDTGIAVYGLQGSGNGGVSTHTGVYGESTEDGGNGVVGVANIGSVAFGVSGRSAAGDGGHFSGGRYGVYGFSSAGVAGYFDGIVQIDEDSTLARPHLRLHETQDGDYARLEFQAANYPFWHIAVGGGAANQMNFFNHANGDVMSLKQDGTLFVKVLTITGGADLAEPFEMRADIPKGAVVVIDEENPGKLKLSERAYDTRVAGVVSGAGGVNPGLTLQQHSKLDSGQQVALSGRVYVQADASSGAIKPGDLLTSSDTPGHAMKVADHGRAQGAILGKAMSALSDGKGLVLVLVTLQ